MATFDEPAAELSLEPLRRLAHALVLEKSSADDVVQEAWLAALQARGEIRGLREWLAGAARRLARNRSRVERRREDRERMAARPEAEPSTVESSARIEILRGVLAAVDRLPQPYRDAVVLRYLDDLPPREIARRLDVPVNTARTHVRRGIERLRADLDAGPGRDRDAFLAALLPLLGPGASGAPPTANPLVRTSRRIVMQHPLAITVSVLGLAAAGWVWRHQNDPGSAREAVEVAAVSTEEEVAPVDPALAPAESRVEAAAPAPGGARIQTSEGWTVRGYVYDGGGAELVGRVFAGPEAEGTPLLEERFHAAADGTFAWTLSPPTTFVMVEVAGDRARFRSLPYRGWFLPGDEAPQTAVVDVYPLDVMIRGSVVDANGAPVAGASVGPKVGDSGRAVASASDGSFALPWTSKNLGLLAIGAWLDGYAPGQATLDRSVPVSDARYELRLEPELRLHGTVRDRAGNPVEGASVSVQDHRPPDAAVIRVEVGGSDPEETTRNSQPTAYLDGDWPTVRTDAEGRWELGGIHPRSVSLELIARAPGFRPEELHLFDPASMTKRSHGIALTRGVTVRGRVLANGAPVWGAYLTAGDYSGELTDVQTWTDQDGRFALENVPPGRQHLWVWRRGLAQLRHDVTVGEGQPELELALEPDHHVGGVLLDSNGEPAAWKQVMAEDASGAQPPRFQVWTTANAEGRFLLRSIPGGRVSVGAPGSPGQEVELDSDDVVVHMAPPQPPKPPSPPSTGGVVVIKESGARPPFPPATEPVDAEPVVTVTESSGSARIDGHLVPPATAALEGQEIELAAVEATVAAGPWGERTDAQGAFSFENLPAGTFELRWLRRDGDSETVDLEMRLTLAAGEARVEDLRPRGNTTVRGRLEFMDIPGRPASNTNVSMPALVPISLKRMEGRTIVPGRRGTIARDGVFELEGVEAGNWAVEARLEFVSVVDLDTDGRAGRDRTTTSSVAMSQVRVPTEGTSEVVISVVRP